MRRLSPARLLALSGVVVLAAACATARGVPPSTAEAPAPAPSAPPAPTAPPTPPPVARAPAPPETLPDLFESDDYVVVRAKPGDTAASLAARHLGDAGKAWMVEEFVGARVFEAGQLVPVPRREWNPSGVTPSGYQLVPVLCYHNFGPQAKGRMLMAAKKFEEQMRYLKAQGYHVISLRQLLEAVSLRRQLPAKSVVLTFDDGYKSFRQHAEPVLRELGFTGTLFVYLDYVGGGRNALSWQDLRELAAAGFDVQAHSKTHGDLRRGAAESEAQYTRRMQAELGQPLALFKQNLGRPTDSVAYPYGYWDEDVLRQTKSFGYVAAFTVRRQANPTFVAPLRINRSQIYAEMSLEDFARNLNVFHAEDLR
jgi:peptidoglycan/xylan/chitin deacetylase (PgdA/CDA1 family)